MINTVDSLQLSVYHRLMSEEKQLYSITEIATMKNKTRQTIHQLIKTREVKTIKVGNYFVVPKEELYKFD